MEELAQSKCEVISEKSNNFKLSVYNFQNDEWNNVVAEKWKKLGRNKYENTVKTVNEKKTIIRSYLQNSTGSFYLRRNTKMC